MANTQPQISEVTPRSAIPGGDLKIRGSHLAGGHLPAVTIGDAAAHLITGSESMLIARVPEGAANGDIMVRAGEQSSRLWSCNIGLPVGTGLHPVANPAVDALGYYYATFSGSRGQKTPVSVFRISPEGESTELSRDIVNATGLAFDREGNLYVSARNDGTVHRLSPELPSSVFVEGMGVATGIAFDANDNLYVGDRSGTIFKVSPERQIYVFCTLEPSLSAYHLAFGPDGWLYVTAPNTSSFDSVHRISPEGAAEVFYRGLGRPQGLAFDQQGNLYVAASLQGRRGIVRIDKQRNAELFVSGPGIVGLAFSPDEHLLVATSSTLFRLQVGVRPFWPHL
jgi:sugar lactone lactonase YvrE